MALLRFSTLVVPSLLPSLFEEATSLTIRYSMNKLYLLGFQDAKQETPISLSHNGHQIFLFKTTTHDL